MTNRASNTSTRVEVFEKPSGKWWWVVALVVTPIFFLIGRSFQGEAPFEDEIAGAVFLVAMTAYPLTSQTMELAMWHLRERMVRPHWWTSKRQNNLGQAATLSGLFAILRLSAEASGWEAAGQLLGWFLLGILPFFALCQGTDLVLSKLSQALSRAKAR